MFIFFSINKLQRPKKEKMELKSRIRLYHFVPAGPIRQDVTEKVWTTIGTIGKKNFLLRVHFGTNRVLKNLLISQQLENVPLSRLTHSLIDEFSLLDWISRHYTVLSVVDCIKSLQFDLNNKCKQFDIWSEGNQKAADCHFRSLQVKLRDLQSQQMEFRRFLSLLTTQSNVTELVEHGQYQLHNKSVGKA